MVCPKVEIICPRHSVLYHSISQFIQHIVFEPLFCNLPLTFLSVKLVLLAVKIFMLFEVRQAILPSPLWIIEYLRPVVVVILLPSHIDHSVDTRTPSKDFPSGISYAPAI